MISRIYIIIFAGLMFVCGPISAFAQEPQTGLVIIVQCKDLRIKNEAAEFFQRNLTENRSNRNLSNLIKRFYFQWPIRDIHVENDGDVYRFDIELRSTVTEFDLHGNGNIKDVEIIRELKDTQAQYQGDDEVGALLERLKKYYAYRGFPGAKIEMNVLPREQTGTVKIVVNIQEGEPCLLDEDLVFEGKASDSRMKKIKNQFRWTKKMRCDQEKVQNQIEGLRQDYNHNYYYQFDIEDPSFEYLNEAQTKAKLHAKLIVGSRIFVEFRGNQYAFERNELLRNAIFLDREKKFNQSFENSSIQGLRNFYESRGYPFAEIQLRKKNEEGLVHLIFEINRGPVIRLNKIRFEGNRNIRSKKLLKVFREQSPVWTKKGLWVASDLSVVMNGLLAYYQSKGYLRTSFYEPVIDIQKDKHEANLLFKINEGEPSYFDSIQVRNNVFMKTREIEKFFGVKKGDPIDPVQMRDAAQRLEYAYQVKGFKYAKVHLPQVDDLVDGLNTYIIDIEEGPRVRIGDITIQGNYSTYDYVITRELRFKSGDLLNPEKINDTRSILLRLGFFQSVTIDEKVRDDLKDVEDVVITVVEGKKRSVIIRPGVSTDEGARLTGSFGYANIGGTGRGASITGKINHRFDSEAILEHKVIFSYLEPKLLGFADGKINLIQEQTEEIQFDISRTSLILGFENNTLKHLRPALQWQLEFRNPFNVDPGARLSPLDQTSARFGSLAAIVDFDYRDNLLNATKGTFHRVQVNYYNRFLLSDADFFQAMIKNNFYFPIYHRFRSVLSVRAGYSVTYGDTKADGITEIPIEKRFRLGGNSSLRGFGLNCVGGLPSSSPENCSDALTSQAPGGNSMINYLWDFLIPLGPSFDFVLFSDGGNAFLDNSDFSLYKIRTTAGFGIRYNTIVGPLRVDYGIKLDRRTGESFGEFHFAVGQF